MLRQMPSAYPLSPQLELGQLLQFKSLEVMVLWVNINFVCK